MRLTKIYTRTGDKGTTRLGEGTVVDKDNIRVECYGTVDELNSAIGLLPELPELTQIQQHLFDIGGELCIPGSTTMAAEHVKFLETKIDELNKNLPPLKEFILPRGVAHLARTICRRAERQLVTLSKTEAINPETLKYLNRLSDFLFVLARTLDRKDILWEHKN